MTNGRTFALVSSISMMACSTGVQVLDGPDGGPGLDSGAAVLDSGSTLDAGAPDASLELCTFTLTLTGGAPVNCEIEAATLSSCADAAECVCRGLSGGTEQDIARCVGDELTPRALITLSDLCQPPATYTLAEALTHRYGDAIEISASCADVPAFEGPVPYESCTRLESRVCTCIPGACDLDSMLGATCLDLTRAQVACINVGLGTGPGACDADLAALARSCIAETYWTLEPARLALSPSGRCQATQGGTTTASVQIELPGDCYEAGPVQAEVIDATMDVVIRGQVWREQGVPCGGATRTLERTVNLQLDGPITWTVRTEPATTTEMVFVNATPPPVVCTDPVGPGEACAVDCDCDTSMGVGLRCVAIRGDAVCESRCMDSCSPDSDLSLEEANRECRPGQGCGFDPDHGWTCTPLTEAACEGGDCPAGMRCATDITGNIENYCAWENVLRAETRHSCRVHADCETDGLECVELSDGTRGCEVRCRTSEMGCPLMHSCRGGVTSPAGSWVCDWIGE